MATRKRSARYSQPPPPPAVAGRPTQHAPGRVRCLGPGCDAHFESPDHCCVRFCPKCRAKQDRNYVPPTASTTSCGDGPHHCEDY
jgi:hypothetical protein